MPTIELTDEQAIHIRRALWDEVNCLSNAVAGCVEEDAACHLHSRSLLLDVIRLLETNAMHHTPGPWTVGGASGNEGEAREIASADRCIAWTASTWDDDEGDVVTEEDDANGHLIAAAPELLGSCRRLLSVLEDVYEDDFYRHGGPSEDAWPAVIAEARLAIAKAEGRSE